MFFGSEKEYEILKNETAEIRSCITRYIGYIISVAGLSGFLAKFYFERSKGQAIDLDIPIILFLSLLVIGCSV